MVRARIGVGHGAGMARPGPGRLKEDIKLVEAMLDLNIGLYWGRLKCPKNPKISGSPQTLFLKAWRAV